MSNILELELAALEGEKLHEVALGAESLGLGFENGASVTFWTRWETNRPIEQLPGSIVASIRLEPERLTVASTDSFELSVDLRDEAYRGGPEAFMYVRGDLRIVFP